MISEVQTLKRAGLRATEVSRLVQVSRPTASNWYRGAHAPHILVKRRLGKLVDAVRRALDAGDFPVPQTVIGTEQRWLYINQTLGKYLKADAA